MRVEIEDLKARYSMRDIVEDRYGLFINRGGFINCPFHNEDTASCKVFNDHYYCFGCGAHGDIFSFVMQMEDCSFKEAFKRLGGNLSGRVSDAQLARRDRLNREKERREKAIRTAKEEMQIWDTLHEWCLKAIQASEVFSDDWCYAQNARPYIEYRLDMSIDNLLNAKRRKA